MIAIIASVKLAQHGMDGKEEKRRTRMIDLYHIFKNVTCRKWDSITDCFELHDYFKRGLICTEYNPRNFTLKVIIHADELADDDINYIIDMLKYRLEA